jgi:hypothetical protein
LTFHVSILVAVSKLTSAVPVPALVLGGTEEAPLRVTFMVIFSARAGLPSATHALRAQAAIVNLLRFMVFSLNFGIADIDRTPAAAF